MSRLRNLPSHHGRMRRWQGSRAGGWLWRSRRHHRTSRDRLQTPSWTINRRDTNGTEQWPLVLPLLLLDRLLAYLSTRGRLFSYSFSNSATVTSTSCSATPTAAPAADQPTTLSWPLALPSLALRGPYPQTHTCIPPRCASLDEVFTFLTRRYAIQHQTMPLGFLVFSFGDKVCGFVFKMKAKGGRAWREVMPDSYRKKQRGAIRDLANLWRLTRNRKLKQEMGARQVHLDSGTYRNGVGPTHFHQCGALLFSLF